MPTLEKEVALVNIRMDGDTQARVNIDADLVEEYAEGMRHGETFPKIKVVQDTRKRDVFWLVDGFHRVLAARKAKRRRFLADVHQGTREDAQWMAYGENKRHGLRRSNEDKVKAAKAALLARPHMTNSALAKHVGVSDPTIAKYRTELEQAGKLKDAGKRESEDGRSYGSHKSTGRLTQIIELAVRKSKDGRPKWVQCALCNGKGKVKTGL